ncbi:Integrase catalytic region [Gemmatirosa kalamazoonensis]|uniref:Integrase catalytic region n=1 Tax=Gemmatirosa kalamazoonensis TaxID=861299 RepID=W0RBA2_9BACT|nr:Integrase catalytic region [Gemmatirosa kalamazoonensis]
MKYACITRHRDSYPVRLMCRVLAVAPSGYYAWRRGASPTAHALADEVLLARVRVAHRESRGTYGAPRVHQELRAQAVRVGKKRVARLMRADGLVGRVRRRGGVRTTHSAHARPIAPNVLARQFAVHDGDAPRALDRVWVSDVTYVPTRAGWLYLATVLDLASRRVIGWAMRDTLEVDLALAALRMALGARRPAPGLVHHSDRGVQYASAEYQALLTQHRLVASMSRKGDCWDNAVAESFFATLELELITRSDWRTRDEARRAIFRYIETWYNRQRRHSTLGYLSPAQYEAQLVPPSAA